MEDYQKEIRVLESFVSESGNVTRVSVKRNTAFMYLSGRVESQAEDDMISTAIAAASAIALVAFLGGSAVSVLSKIVL